MRTELYWIEGPWPGWLAIMPRPRGGDWLEEEIQAWQRAGIDQIVSLLTSEEQKELGLTEEAELCRTLDIAFENFPVEDRGVPPSFQAFSDWIAHLGEQLGEGKNIAIHCRQGIGRATLFAICLLIYAGIKPTQAIERVGSARGCPVPETMEQRRWIADFAKSLFTRLPQ